MEKQDKPLEEKQEKLPEPPLSLQEQVEKQGRILQRTMEQKADRKGETKTVEHPADDTQ